MKRSDDVPHFEDRAVKRPGPPFLHRYFRAVTGQFAGEPFGTSSMLLRVGDPRPKRHLLRHVSVRRVHIEFRHIESRLR